MRSQTTTLVLVALAMLGVCCVVWLLLTTGELVTLFQEGAGESAAADCSEAAVAEVGQETCMVAPT